MTKGSDAAMVDFKEIVLQPSEGNGKIMIFNVFPGIRVAFIRICAPALPEVDMGLAPRLLLINYCINGRCELLLEDNIYAYIKRRDFSISTQGAKINIFTQRNVTKAWSYFSILKHLPQKVEICWILLGLIFHNWRKCIVEMAKHMLPKRK
jgi:hypothetical protein